MAIINKGKSFANGEQLTADKINQVTDNATFAAGAVDNTSTQLSGGAIIVKDGGVTTAKLNDGSVTTAKIADSNVIKSKIENVADMKVLGNTSGSASAPQEVSILDDDTMATASSTTLATSESIKAYVDNSAQTFTPSTYAGEESVTLPNGLIMKFGRVANTTNGAKTVNFNTSFPTGIISAQATAECYQNETISCLIVGTPNVNSMQVGISDVNYNTGFYWQAIGY